MTGRPAGPALSLLALLAALVVFAGCGSQRAPVMVTITGVTSSPSLQPGNLATLAFSGATGSVDLGVTEITFAPASGGTGAAVSPSGQAAQSNGQIVLTFTVPNLTVTSPASYQVSVAGRTAQGVEFSSQAFMVTIDPGASIASLTPASGGLGQSLTVTITGANTNFAQGQTQANFGAGIAVNGAGEGLPGNVAVVNATTATASLVIDPAAAVGSRTVTVTTGGQTATLTSGFTVHAALLPLVAAAGGPYKGDSGSPVAFDGSGSSDPNGLSLAYAWNFGDGGSGSGATPTHTYAKAGTYTVTLTVSDSDGLSASASTTATIVTLAAPTAVAGGPYTGTVNQAIAFNGSGSTDPNQSALTYAWSFGDGATGSGATPTHAYAAAGSYKATLTVTDTYNLSASATATVTVSAAAQKPTAVPGGPYTGTVGQPVSFNGSASTDPNGLPLTYAWDFGDGTVGSGAMPQHSYSTAGSFAVKLTVSDSSGLSDTEATTATIAAASTDTPVANAGGPYSGVAGQAVQFNGSASSDPKNETLTYAWNFGDSSTGTGATPSHTYQSAGTYNVTLTVTNTDNVSATASATATITAGSSQLVAATNGPYTGNVSQVLSFDGSSSTGPTADTLTYNWSFGDGGTASGEMVTHTYTQAGTYTVTLTVVDGANQASTTSTATITAPLSVQILTPAQGSLFNTNTVTVTGTAGSTAQSVVVNGTAATLSNGSFTASVAVREGVNLLTAVAADAHGNTGTASTSITVDLSPPILSILQPQDQSMVTTQQITVAGMVTDQVTGTVNANNVTVTVNGQPAAVSNRSFSLSGLVLVPGTNTVTVVATDQAGNTSQSVAHVSLANTAAQQHIVILSGNNQSGVISTVLPQPLAVQLVSGTGSPIANRLVTFTVSASDGIVESLPLQGQTLTITSDANGKASVLMTLGSRAGLGINQVSVTSPGFLGSAVFTETTTAAAPAYIHEFLGNNQRGILNQPLAQAFQVIVQDSGGDPIGSVPVTFTVTGGDGTLNGGQTTYTVSTNSDGRAMATLTLGEQEGINNNTVSADFANDPNAAVNFYASGYASGDPSATSISGVVMDNGGNAVPNATVRLQNTNLSTTTDVNGHFLISGAPVGTVTLLADGSTTTLAETLPSLSFLLQDLPGQNNTLNMPIYLPIIDTQSAQTAGGDQPVTLTLRGMPGSAITIAPNSVTFPDGSHVGQITLSQVKTDLIPMPPPNGIPPAFAWTIQPAGTVFSVPVAITIPNTQGLAPGQVQEFYQYDHDLEQFVSVGTLRVSPDGSVLNSDPGFGITKAGWSSPGCNPPPPVCTQSCDDNNVCTSDSQNPQTCACMHTPKGGGCGNNPPAGRNNCQQPGMCMNGACNSKPRTSGSCDDGMHCTDNPMCGLDGVCRGTPKPDKDVAFTGVGFQVELENTTLFVQSMLRQAFGAVGNNFSATVSESGQTKQVCCESQNGAYLNDTNAQYQLSGGISTQKYFLPYPPWSIPFPGGTGGYGVYSSFGITASGTISYDTAQCSNYKCATGTFQIGGSVTLGGGFEALDPVNHSKVVELTVSGSAGPNIQFGTSGDCQSISYSIGLSAVNLTVTEAFPGGVVVQIPVWNPVPAFTFTDGSLTIPSN